MLVGIHLEEPYFSHGQLYVGWSIVGGKQILSSFVPQTKTKRKIFVELIVNDLLTSLVNLFMSSNRIFFNEDELSGWPSVSTLKEMA